MAMKIALGSASPVKIKAVKAAFKKAFSLRINVVSIKVNSGVSDQPMTDEETYKGALNRAKQSLKKTNADFGVGIEGGIQTHKHGVFSNAWVALIDKNGRVGRASSARFQLPIKAIRFIEKGEELGIAIDKLTGEKETKLRGGAYTALSAGKVSRSKAYEQALLCALMPFLTPSYWK